MVMQGAKRQLLIVEGGNFFRRARLSTLGLPLTIIDLRIFLSLIDEHHIDLQKVFNFFIDEAKLLFECRRIGNNRADEDERKDQLRRSHPNIIIVISVILFEATFLF